MRLASQPAYHAVCLSVLESTVTGLPVHDIAVIRICLAGCAWYLPGAGRGRDSKRTVPSQCSYNILRNWVIESPLDLREGRRQL